MIRYRASTHDCTPCALKPVCCPGQPNRKILRSIHEGARDMAMLFDHLKRIVKLDRLRLRGPSGARDEFLLAATAQNLRKLAKLIPPTAQACPA
jgi:hypothetical protein